MSINIEQYNTDQGNLNLKDTERLLSVLSLMENNEFGKAYTELTEFVAEIGYDENPAERVKEND